MLIMHPIPCHLMACCSCCDSKVLSATASVQQVGGANAPQSSGQEPQKGGLATSDGRTSGRLEAYDSFPRVASLASWGGPGVLCARSDGASVRAPSLWPLLLAKPGSHANPALAGRRRPSARRALISGELEELAVPTFMGSSRSTVASKSSYRRRSCRGGPG